MHWLRLAGRIIDNAYWKPNQATLVLVFPDGEHVTLYPISPQGMAQSNVHLVMRRVVKVTVGALVTLEFDEPLWIAQQIICYRKV